MGGGGKEEEGLKIAVREVRIYALKSFYNEQRRRLNRGINVAQRRPHVCANRPRDALNCITSLRNCGMCMMASSRHALISW